MAQLLVEFYHRVARQPNNSSSLCFTAARSMASVQQIADANEFVLRSIAGDQAEPVGVIPADPPQAAAEANVEAGPGSPFAITAVGQTSLFVALHSGGAIDPIALAGSPHAVIFCSASDEELAHYQDCKEKRPDSVSSVAFFQLEDSKKAKWSLDRQFPIILEFIERHLQQNHSVLILARHNMCFPVCICVAAIIKFFDEKRELIVPNQDDQKVDHDVDKVKIRSATAFVQMFCPQVFPPRRMMLSLNRLFMS
eukprot:TRINITY_DN8935_c0_g1_i4.p1 TRINITY_DN8935_c0_g1~~TRINITY_DN8935_c0_g1_i4.p1  ORF type:complete len:287 (-),score=45.35 TRINITY_DN8935_c0_g1_i4:53-811(-)